MYKVNKQKCLGIDNCGLCQKNCPGSTEKGKDGKSKIVDQEKLEQCGGKNVCPMGAIEKVDESGETQSQTQGSPTGLGQDRGSGSGRGRGVGKGRGLGKGMGRGLGMGPRDGRGKGRGGGGRK